MDESTHMIHVSTHTKSKVKNLKFTKYESTYTPHVSTHEVQLRKKYFEIQDFERF